LYLLTDREIADISAEGVQLPDAAMLIRRVDAAAHEVSVAPGAGGAGASSGA
jgi:hypothetical protein